MNRLKAQDRHPIVEALDSRLVFKPLLPTLSFPAENATKKDTKRERKVRGGLVLVRLSRHSTFPSPKMPSYLFPLNRASTHEPAEVVQHDEDDQISHVAATAEDEEAVADLHKTITGKSHPAQQQTKVAGPFAGFEDYLRSGEEDGAPSVPLSVCFKGVTTYGRQEGASSAKTLKDAIVRTLTMQEIYEWTLKRLISPERVESGRALIRDFTGVVRNGEMML